ncbi:hypothetical protein F2Q69_00061193 [Brassica cretica]|uniref:Uncharacterized protein n=1 Tax=Brassica cretica TaxID=69181 RepID=A0A8S9RB02_BRACR|nr:hypothetical protein F2Q69_00061193 [Brassica cretica]
MDLRAHLLKAEFELGDIAYGYEIWSYLLSIDGKGFLGSESSEMWSPPVAVGFVLNRRRHIICGRLVWPSGAVSAATKAASWSLVVF